VLMAVLILWMAAPTRAGSTSDLRKKSLQPLGGHWSQMVAGTASPHKSISTRAPM
jgi:hypothetical protein